MSTSTKLLLKGIMLSHFRTDTPTVKKLLVNRGDLYVLDSSTCWIIPHYRKGINAPLIFVYRKYNQITLLI